MGRKGRESGGNEWKDTSERDEGGGIGPDETAEWKQNTIIFLADFSAVLRLYAIAENLEHRWWKKEFMGTQPAEVVGRKF